MANAAAKKRVSANARRLAWLSGTLAACTGVQLLRLALLLSSLPQRLLFVLAFALGLACRYLLVRCAAPSYDEVTGALRAGGGDLAGLPHAEAATDALLLCCGALAAAAAGAARAAWLLLLLVPSRAATWLWAAVLRDALSASAAAGADCAAAGSGVAGAGTSRRRAASAASGARVKRG